jgi:putative ABC transport system permease protein
MTIGELWRRLTFLLHRERFREDLEEEMRLHQALRAEAHQESGTTSADAAAAARREFGNPGAMQETSRDVWGARWLDDLGQDLGYAVRSLARHPTFTVTVVCTLVLGIGANVAMFSILDRLFIQAPPGVAQPGQVRKLFQSHVDQRILSVPSRSVFNYGDLRAVRAALPAAAAGYTRPWPTTLAPNDLPAVDPTYVSDDYFGLLGVHAELGRLFTAEETRVETVAAVAVISHHLWTTRFGDDPHVLGRTIHIDSHPYTIVGVAGDRFHGIDLAPVDLWLPLGALIMNATFNPPGAMPGSGRPPNWYASGGVYLQIVLRTGPEGMAHDLAARVTAVLRAADPGDTTSQASLISRAEGFRQDAGRSVVSIATRLAGVAAILLLIACANVATLLLARGLRRRPEMAVRLALGAGRWRLVRQLLTEHVLLALMGGATAVVAATWAATGLRRALFTTVQWGTPVFGLRLTVFAAVTALLVGVAAGLAPAWAVSGPDLAAALHGSTRTGYGRRSRLRNVMVASQSALSVVLLAGAGLFVRSLHNVRSIDIGYSAERLVLAHVPYDRGEPIAVLGAKLPDLAERIGHFPGVEKVARMANPMMTGFPLVPLFLPGAAATQEIGGADAHIAFVSPEYFATVSLRPLAGRLFTPRDGMEVTIVGQTLATTAWPGESAIGKCLIVTERDAPCSTVIGVVSDAHVRRRIEAPSLQVYLPLHGFPGSAMVIRAVPTRVSAVAAEARRMFADAFGADGGRLVQTMTDVLAPELRPWRLGATLFSAAGLCALLVAAVGIYGSVAYGVSERTHEMGLRAALGARSPTVVRLVVGQGVRVVTMGVVFGIGTTLALGRVVASMLYGLTPHDAAVLVAVSLVLVAVSVVACLAPAWRAMRVDPIVALRSE